MYSITSTDNHEEHDMPAKKVKRVFERQMAEIVYAILAERPKHTATFAELREIIPTRVALSRADRAPSTTRDGEEMWEQIVRNITVHKRAGFEATANKDGIRLTARVRTKA